jgi:hypothetical protein
LSWWSRLLVEAKLLPVTLDGQDFRLSAMTTAVTDSQCYHRQTYYSQMQCGGVRIRPCWVHGGAAKWPEGRLTFSEIVTNVALGCGSVNDEVCEWGVWSWPKNLLDHATWSQAPTHYIRNLLVCLFVTKTDCANNFAESDPDEWVEMTKTDRKSNSHVVFFALKGLMKFEWRLTSNRTQFKSN